MSMLTDQISGLRERATVLRQGRWCDSEEDAAQLEQAADTIESLCKQVDELNKTLSASECENKAKSWGEFECSECGFYADFGSDLHRVRLCPDCGKAVKR